MPTSEAPRIFPTLRYNNAAGMIDWLGKAFGFAVHAKYMNGADVGHAELALGSSMIMIGSSRPDAYGAIVGEPGQNGGKSVYLAVEDVDAVHDSAKAAGAVIVQPLTNRDYGSREFICRDPEGNIWSVGTYWPKAGEPAS
ncbi:putative glyoxalase superfamily protein PhnB [Aminobacter lissarensis]|uniref:Glyoxalase superfamily protein PhnB n=1 Tax=Aminobacter carboxidus TaxID=376165 RepID=A0A8E1WBY0_9HYPH|nr:VOC family protein [Aminobacter lissarensis]MBB6464795.1 putative glyoxalase superfamily protein PhnB [Aminobacter lissarensis]